ncbi:MAG: hypothetical protein LJF06_17245, partial [Gemmatimonadetes bacterium]|nr:hypothetical protein [Gemmatimonadota bacterium]
MLRTRISLALVLAAATGPGAAQAQVQDPAHAIAVRAVAARSTVHPGDLVPVAVVLDYLKGFHSWPHTPVVPPAFADL